MKATETGSLTLIKIIAEVCHELAEGELTQLDNACKHSIDEGEYFVMIRKKTAALISACSEMGAISAGASADIVAKCRIFGEYLGYCFQIKDDIFDYYDDINIGKPTKNDILEGKITLPLLYALKTAPEKEFAHYINIINTQSYTPENVTALIELAKNTGGIEYAEKRFLEYKEKALEIICSLPESEARNSLILLAEYFAERKC
jgi:octaprenyl-diphosphate synthase